MTADSTRRGIALSCDAEGVVQRVVRDDLGLSDRAAPGTHLVDLGGESARLKIGQFLDELRTNDAAYDWEVGVPVGERMVVLHLAGARMGDDFLVTAASSRNGLAQLTDELMRINNEQTNVVRATAKDLSLAAGATVVRDDSIYEELTRLNNEMANLQREMARKNVSLEALNAQKNALLGMAAHDLRTPLGAIMSYAEFLHDEAANVLSDEHREFVTTIRDQSQFMLRLVSELLDVSSLEAGQLRLDRQPTDLVALVTHSVALNRVLAARKGITIEFTPPDACPLLAIDAGKVEQVLNNLISNAVKFSHPETRVRVDVQCGDTHVTLSVQDEGQGIPATDIPRLFVPFGKVSVRSTAGEASTGLGLAIVRRMVEGHGGRIWVESVVGEGSTFFFTLPTSDPGTVGGA